MLYYRCPTCRCLLSNKQIPYENKLKQICNSKTLSKEQKDKEKQLLLTEVGLSKKTNMCCRMRMMSFVPLIEIII